MNAVRITSILGRGLTGKAWASWLTMGVDKDKAKLAKRLTQTRQYFKEKRYKQLLEYLADQGQALGYGRSKWLCNAFERAPTGLLPLGWVWGLISSCKNPNFH